MTTLAPGHHLYPVDDGTWRHAAPADRFVRISGDPEVLTAFQHLTHGIDALAAERLGADGRQALLGLTEEYAKRDLLSPATEPARREPARPTVWIDGDGPVADAVVGLLPGRARVHRGRAPDDVDLLISCAGWLPDRRWRELDAWARETATPWHRVHAEGTRFFIGPLSIPDRTASYVDVRGRRLAACRVAEELLHLWAHLDEGPLPPVRWPGPAGTAIIAGLLAQDAIAYLEHGEPMAPNTQFEVDPATGLVRPRPVLPLPETAP